MNTQLLPLHAPSPGQRSDGISEDQGSRNDHYLRFSTEVARKEQHQHQWHGTSGDSTTERSVGGQSVKEARKLALVTAVVAAKQHAMAECEHDGSSLEVERAELAKAELGELQQRAELVLPKYEVLPMIGAAAIAKPIKHWSPLDVKSWLGQLSFDTGIAHNACELDVNGESLQAFTKEEFLALGTTSTIEASRLVNAVQAVSSVDATVDFILNLRDANTKFHRTCDGNESIWIALSKLYWSTNFDGTLRHSRFTRIMLCALSMFGVTALIQLYAFVNNWDSRPQIVVQSLSCLTLTLVLRSILKNLKPAAPAPSIISDSHINTTTLPSPSILAQTNSVEVELEIGSELSCGNLIRLCGSLPLSTQDLARMQRMRNVLCVICALAMIALGPIIMTSDAVLGPHRTTGNVRLASNSTLWGGHAGSAFAISHWAVQRITMCLAIPPLACTFLYLIVACSLVAYRSAEDVCSKCKADPRLRPADQEVFIDEMGLLIKDLEISILVPLSTGLGPPLAAVGCVCAFGCVAAIPSVLDPDDDSQISSTILCIALLVGFAVVLLIPALTTTSCTKIVMGVNHLRATCKYNHHCWPCAIVLLLTQLCPHRRQRDGISPSCSQGGYPGNVFEESEPKPRTWICCPWNGNQRDTPAKNGSQDCRFRVCAGTARTQVSSLMASTRGGKQFSVTLLLQLDSRIFECECSIPHITTSQPHSNRAEDGAHQRHLL
eukprot:COSAG01_NODE_4310_length_5142_cov_14.830855_7_plen_721_part_00